MELLQSVKSIISDHILLLLFEINIKQLDYYEVEILCKQQSVSVEELSTDSCPVEIWCS